MSGCRIVDKSRYGDVKDGGEQVQVCCAGGLCACAVA